MRNKKINKSKNLNLALYFGILVVFIILVSLIFKIFDIVRESKFDGENRFSVALIKSKNVDIITVSPKEGSLARIKILNSLKEPDIKNLLMPIDAYVVVKSDFNSDSKSYFLKIFLNSRKIKKNLSLFDLLKLSLYSASLNSEKIIEESVSKDDAEKMKLISESFFKDPKIVGEKLSIQIINSTSVSGLGNKLARYISNMGGQVVLVKSSQDEAKNSVILYQEPSYTAKKLSEKLDISLKKDENNSISDVKIIIGKDKESLFNYQ